MGRKTFSLILKLNLFILLFSCTHGSLRRKSPKPEVNENSTQKEIIEDIEVPVEESESQFKPVKYWGVWIRGVAVDSFAGLGFLQQLENSKIRPSKVAGTGMGCWIAMSWALRNRGNYAEWQAMKFDSWEGITRGLIGRISRKTRKDIFNDYINELKSSQKQSLYEIPVECPLYDKNKRSLDLAQDLKLEDRLYKQFDLSILEFGDFLENQEYTSGASSRNTGEKFLESLGEDFNDHEDESAWIILETSANHKLWGSSQDIVKGVTQKGVRWVRVPIAKELPITAQQLKDFKLRRRWLLEGRRDAKSFLHAQEIKDFLSL